MLVRGDVVVGGVELGGFEGKTVDFVVVPGVSGEVFEGKVTIEIPEP